MHDVKYAATWLLRRDRRSEPEPGDQETCVEYHGQGTRPVNPCAVRREHSARAELGQIAAARAAGGVGMRVRCFEMLSERRAATGRRVITDTSSHLAAVSNRRKATSTSL